MNRIGSVIRIYGMGFTVEAVDIYRYNKPLYVLRRNFDGSFWYAICRRVTRFTHIKRIFDASHANLDEYDVMNTTDIAVRRI